MYQSILVPLDGSAFSEHALPVAQQIAHNHHAMLHVVHVHVPIVQAYFDGAPIIDDEADQRARQAEHVWLERIATQLRSPTTSVTVALVDGEIEDAITTYAITQHIDLVVLTTHARGGIARTWLGSTGNALMRHSIVPLLLLHAPFEHAAQDPPRPLQCVLIPVDGSRASERIIPYALALGNQQTQYTLLMVVTHPRHTTLIGSHEQQISHELDAAEVYLDRLALPFRQHGARIQTQVVADQSPAALILDEASLQGSDLIAMTTHGRGGMSRLIMGSIADTVVRNTTTPVLTLRPIIPLEEDFTWRETNHQYVTTNSL